MKLQSPIKWGKDKDKGSKQLENAMRIEAGLSKIKGTEFLLKRGEFTDEFLSGLSKVIDLEVTTLAQKKNKSKEDEARLDFKMAQLVNFESYRALKRAGMQWSASGEDKDMSERYSAYEKVFARQWNNPAYQEMLFAMASYLQDISYQEKHVEPAPTIFMQMPPTGQRVYLGDTIEKEE